MTERTQEYAALAAGTYQDLLIGDRIRAGNDDYVVFAAAASPISGFRAAAFRDESNGRTVLAYRGTDGANDYVVVAAMFSAKINVQQWEADAFTRHAIDLAEDYAAASHKPLNVTVTGHSLGGTLAQINASKYHLHQDKANESCKGADIPVEWKRPATGATCALKSDGRYHGDCATGWVDGKDIEEYSMGLNPEDTGA